MNDRLEYRRSLGLPKADETDLLSMLRANANEPHMTIGGRPFAIEAANQIDALTAEKEQCVSALKEIRAWSAEILNADRGEVSYELREFAGDVYGRVHEALGS